VPLARTLRPVCTLRVKGTHVHAGLPAMGSNRIRDLETRCRKLWWAANASAYLGGVSGTSFLERLSDLSGH
jgi:hypothetical protein